MNNKEIIILVILGCLVI